VTRRQLLAACPVYDRTSAEIVQLLVRGGRHEAALAPPRALFAGYMAQAAQRAEHRHAVKPGQEIVMGLRA